MPKSKKTIEELRAAKHIGTMLDPKEFEEQRVESHRKHLEDYKKILEANGYRVVKVSKG